jgi:hypothetical protein
LAEAEPVYRELLAIEQRVHGLDHQNTTIAMSNLAGLLSDEGHWAECEKLCRRTLAIQLRTLGPQNPYTLNSKINVAALLLRACPKGNTLFLPPVHSQLL